jgi:hypothetical protein
LRLFDFEEIKREREDIEVKIRNLLVKPLARPDQKEKNNRKKKAFSSHLLFSRDVESALGSRTRRRGHAGHVWQREHHRVFVRGETL